MNSTAPRSFVVVQKCVCGGCDYLPQPINPLLRPTAGHTQSFKEGNDHSWFPPQVFQYNVSALKDVPLQIIPRATLSLAPPLGRQDASHVTHVISFPPQREHVRSRWSALSRWESRDWKRIHSCNNVAEPDGKPRAVWLHSSCPSY